MKVKITITAIIKKPKVGDSFGGYGINGRTGYWEEPIKKVRKQYIIVADRIINIKHYAYQEAMQKQKKKVDIKIMRS